MELGIPGIEDAILVGQGGSAVVYRGRQVKLERTVAIKVLKGSWDDSRKARFDAERRAMGRLSEDAGIVPIYEASTTSHGDPYFIMPYYENGSLKTRVDSFGPVPWAEAVDLMEAVSETVAIAHSADIIHRDIKPANLLIDKAGRPLVGDFGIAKIASELGGESDSKDFTPAFSAPELFSFEGTSSPSIDVYGLGATLWSLLAGAPPFVGRPCADSNSVTLISRVFNEPVGDLRATVPPPICMVVERAMSKQVSERPGSVAQFLVELRRAKGLAKTSDWKPGESGQVPGSAGHQGSIGLLTVEQVGGPPPRAGLALESGWQMSPDRGVSSAVAAARAAELPAHHSAGAQSQRDAIPATAAPHTKLGTPAGERGRWLVIGGLVLLLLIVLGIYVAGPSESPDSGVGSSAMVPAERNQMPL